MNWERFVVLYGARARLRDLSHVLGVSQSRITSFRSEGMCDSEKAKGFAELFTLWHLRAPREDEWPAPQRAAGNAYEWLGPEDLLLASLVGTLEVPKIAAVLTSRLCRITGDRKAIRTIPAVFSRINHIGLQQSDIPGGLSVTDAGRIVGTRQIVEHAIRTGKLQTKRFDRRLLIPYLVWEEFMASRSSPPEGYVLLRKIRDDLGLSSDKLQGYAARGLVPTAVRCFPVGVGGASSPNGVFYLDPKVAQQLIEDRRAGKPMPWFGQPDPGNLKVTWKLYEQRRHPDSCKKCVEIWGAPGAPKNVHDFETRYPSLELGAKRHLTFRWDPGHTVAEMAARAKVPEVVVHLAITSGTLQASGEQPYITKTDAARWIARRCPTGEGSRSWITPEDAERDYSFTKPDLDSLISAGRINVKTRSSPTSPSSPLRVCRQQCSDLRNDLGYSLKQAATMLGVPITRAQELLDGLNWRKAAGFTLAAINSARQRLESAEGYSIAAAADLVGKPVGWVEEQILCGVIHVSKPTWSQRIYVAAPMLARLRIAAKTEPSPELPPPDWISLSAVATMAGVSTGTVSLWKRQGKLTPMPGPSGDRYDPKQVRDQARIHWCSARYSRPVLPAWLDAEAQI